MSIDSGSGGLGAERQHPTSSRRAATEWLRQRRTPAELRLFLEALRFAQSIKSYERRQHLNRKQAKRRSERARARAERLQRDNPDFEINIRPSGSEGWRAGPFILQIRTYRALDGFPKPREARARFSRAVEALADTIGKTPIGTVAAICLMLAARCVRIKKPSGLEAAALAVIAGIEAPAEHQNQRDEAEHRWRARFRLVLPRARDALLDHAVGLRHAPRFENGKLVWRQGVKRPVPRSRPKTMPVR